MILYYVLSNILRSVDKKLAFLYKTLLALNLMMTFSAINSLDMSFTKLNPKLFTYECCLISCISWFSIIPYGYKQNVFSFAMDQAEIWAKMISANQITGFLNQLHL